MKTKNISKDKLIELSKRKECTINTNLSKSIYNENHKITITHRCNHSETIQIKKFRHYICSCTKIREKFCLVCNKPHKGKTQLCATCKKKAHAFDVGAKKLVYICDVLKQKDPFLYIEKNPSFIKRHIDMDKATEIKKSRRALQSSEKFKRGSHVKGENDIPLYVLNILKVKPLLKLITIDGDRKNPNIYYLCEKCNKEHCQSFEQLKIKSHKCDGTKSTGELIVEKYLKSLNVSFKIQHDTLQCINPKTKKQLPYDIEITNRKILIEVQGKQHYEFVEIFHGTIENFEYQQYKDKYKKDFAEQSGYELIYIDYDEIQNESYKSKLLNCILRN